MEFFTKLRTWLTMLLLFVGVSVSWGQEVKFITSTSGDIKSNSGVTKDGITLSFANSNNNNTNWQSNHVRFLTGCSFTVSSSANISKIVVNCVSGYEKADLKVNNASIVSNNDKTTFTYNPSSPFTSVTITNNGTAQARIQSIVVTKAGGGSQNQTEQFSYTIETIGEGTTIFKDGNNNEIKPGDKVGDRTVITPTFTPVDGYEFTSWEYWGTSDGVEQWKTLSDNKFTITKDVKFRVTYTAVAPKAKYPVTIETPTNGSLTIKDGTTTISSGDEIEEGKTLTVEVTPNDGYRFKNWGYKDGDANWVGNMTSTFTHTMPSAPCSFKATFEEIPTYTVVFSVNGSIVKSDVLEEGVTISAPTVEDINGKKFVGWVKTPTVDATNAPIYETIGKVTEDVTYYAVFANQTGNGADVLTKITAINQVTAGTYALISYDEDVYVSNAAATGSCPSQQFVRTASGNIKIADDMKWTVIGDNNEGFVFESVSEPNKYLWGGSANDGTRVNTTSTKSGATKIWYIEENQDYGIVLYNKASDPNKRYLSTYNANDWRNYTSVSKTQKAANLYKVIPSISYSDYCTIVETPTISATITISSAGYSTYYNSASAYVMPEGVTGYIWDEKLVEAYEPEEVVPANTALVLKGAEGTYNLVFTAEEGIAPEKNSLEGTDSAELLADVPGYNYYALSVGKAGSENAGKVGFYWLAENGGAFTNGAHKAYLKLPKTASSVKAYTFDGMETAISSVNAEADTQMYDLSGRKVSKAQKGLYIVNGKKVVR